MKKLAIALVCILLIGGIIGGTLAWLTDTTESVTNTFTTSGIDITLEETGATKENDAYINSYQMIPGWTIEKDPVVTVKGGSEKCFLFVKLEKAGDFDDFMTYEMADGWTELETGVYYRKVEKSDTDQKFPVIKDDTVTVKSEVTKEMMNGLNAEGATQPTLTITAYATQLMQDNTHEFSAADAWAKVKT